MTQETLDIAVENGLGKGPQPYLQNRELSWLDFDLRVLDQGNDEAVPLIERLNFVSIFWSNLREFFMVRVGSLTDLALVKKPPLDSKTGMTPTEQLDAIYERCHELYPIQEQAYENLRAELAKEDVCHLRPEDLSDEQREYVMEYARVNVVPFLSPQIINTRHPFPHLENGDLYVVVRVVEPVDKSSVKVTKNKNSDSNKNVGAKDVTLGLIPMPRKGERIVKLPGKGFQFILLEHVVEMAAPEVFSMYTVTDSNVICVTRNADIDVIEGIDEAEDADYREFMKRILKKRTRLAPVRLESERPFGSKTVEKLLLKRLGLRKHMHFVTTAPLNLSFTYALGDYLNEKQQAKLLNTPFTPQWAAEVDPNRPVLEQALERELLFSYPYESMDPFVQLLREASVDPNVISIKITLYRLASQSHLAEALIAAAENGKEVTALFELRARFDESNNIVWSQRFEEAGCNVIYGFHDYKVHSKICAITRQGPDGLQYITQLGTGNYNEKTAKLYTDFSFITSDEAFGKDAVKFFRNMSLENVSNEYDIMRVAPLQIKPLILMMADREIAKAQAGEACGLFFKTNSVTDLDIINKIVEASQAGVPITLFVRGICCLVPGVAGYTENVRVVSIVGRLLEHSRIYGFGPVEDCRLFLSSADLMTRNMDKRVEIAWPILDSTIKQQIIDYLSTCLSDNSKLRELKADKTYTALGELAVEGEPRREAHEILIAQAADARAKATLEEAAKRADERHHLDLSHEQRAAEVERLSAQQDEFEAQLQQAEPAVESEPVAVSAPEPVAEPEPASAADAVAEAVAEAVAPAEPEPAPEPAPETTNIQLVEEEKPEKLGLFARILNFFKRS